MEVQFLSRENELKLSYEKAIYVSNELKKLKIILLPDIFRESFFNFNAEYQIWFGSRVSAKSYVKAIQMLYKATNQKYFRCLFARQTKTDARDSQFQLFKDIINSFYPWLSEEFTIRETTMTIIHNKTGHFLKGASFEDPPRSLSEYTDFWVDEPITRTGSIKMADLLDISGTLRNSYGILSQKHLTFNPISIDTWIYKDFFSEQKVFESEIVKANWGHNPFCPPEKIAEFETIKIIDPERYHVDALGNWGIIKPDTPFFYNYKPSKHETTESIPINDNLPICLSFDFNVILSCLAGQVSIYDRYIRKIKEFHDPAANMDLPEFIDHIVNYFGKEKRYLITGDASGNNKSAFTSGHSSGFSIIFNKLNELGVDFEDMVPASNPSHYNSKLICNYILGKETDWLISATDCPITCNDYKRMEQDSSGGLNKKHADANNYGHCGDTGRYFDHVFCYDLWKEYVTLN